MSAIGATVNAEMQFLYFAVILIASLGATVLWLAYRIRKKVL
jgi:hypothetical protein